MEVLQRKLSRGNSGNGASMWSRRTLKRSQTAPSPAAPPQDEPMSSEDERVVVNNLPPAHSILPEPMQVSYDAWAAVPLPAPKLYYPLHNPVGPRYYRNFHLIPPSQIRPGARPPSVFSPSFPPISTQTSQDHADSGPSRTPSHSTLPTPSSSQTAVGDGPKGRPRKTSQTTPDNVDLMDVTDPWGTNWHHTSPYDIGMPAGSASADHDNPRRPRRASMTAAQNGYKTTSKSPLSQSTSAVHLQSEMPPIHMPRKLSKRQKPPAASTVASKDKDKEPESPSEQVPATHTVDQNPTLPKRMSVAPPPGQDSMLASRPSLKKEKRGSVLGRLARRLSNMRRSFDGYGKSLRSEDDWHHISPSDTRATTNLNTPEPMYLDTNQERVSVKRVPPPAMQDSSTAPIPQQSDPSTQDGDSASSISLEAPFSIGKLTIANPDMPSAELPTPNGHTAPLPLEKLHELSQSPVSAGPTSNLLSPLPKSVQIPSPPPTPGPPTPAKDDIPPQRPISQRPLSTHRSTELPQSPFQLSPLAPSLSGPSDNHTTPRPGERSLQPDQTPISPAPTPSPVLHVPTSPTTTRRTSTRYSTAPSQPSQIPPNPRPASTVESIASSVLSASTTTSYVPFPGASNANAYQQPLQEVFLSGATARSSYLSYADSPLSGISVLANPPTPYTNDVRLSMLATPEPSLPIPIPIPAPPPKPPAKSPLGQTPIVASSSSSSPPPLQQQPTPESSSHSRSRSHSNSNNARQSQGNLNAKRTTVTSTINRDSSSIRQSTSGGGGTGPRQTETFKLVRSESGNAHATGEAIRASGEQWEVAEKQEREKRRESRRERERDKEREHEREKEREQEKERERERRESRHNQDDVDKSHRRKSHRNTTLKASPPPEPAAAPTANGRPPSNQGHHRESSSSRQEENMRREREEQARRERERDEQARREREREEQMRRERDREEQARREREEQARRQERTRRERDERIRKEREEQARWEWEEQMRREQEEQARREHEEHARREREEQARREEWLKKEREDQARREKEEQRRREKEKEREREREREKEKERERKEREREEQKAREREERKKEEKKKSREEKDREKKERRSKDGHKSKEYRNGEDEKAKESENKHRSKADHHHKSRGEKSSRRREKEKERESRGPKPDLNKPQPPPPPASDESSSTDAPPAHLNRQPSASTRPTSELPSAADMNALRAKEAWEMERLWKARSMYSVEADGVPAATAGNSIVNGSTNSIPLDAQVAMSMGMNLGPSTNGMYGSSHTAFLVQNTFHRNQQQAFGIYRQSPGAMGSGYWPSPPTIPSLHDSITSYDLPTPDPSLLNGMGPYRYGGYGGSSPGLLGPVPSAPPPGVVHNAEKDLAQSNPLPEPPRESTYEPAPLSSDYWKKYTGLTTV